MLSWGRLAPVYDRAMALSGWHRAQLALVSQVQGSVLDVGCGTAFLADHLGPGYLGIDSSLDMLVRSRGARLVCADARALPLPDRSFDTVLTTGFLGLLDPAQRAVVLRELARVCRGELLLLEPVAPLGVPRRWLALSRHPLRMAEFREAGLTARVSGPLVLAGAYRPVRARVLV